MNPRVEKLVAVMAALLASLWMTVGSLFLLVDIFPWPVQWAERVMEYYQAAATEAPVTVVFFFPFAFVAATAPLIAVVLLPVWLLALLRWWQRRRRH
jgi:hypothetical protein